MEKNEKYYSEKTGLSDYILYGTYSIYLLGTVIAVHVHDYLKNRESKMAEA